MASEVTTLIETIKQSAHAGNYAALREAWQMLYDRLKAGHPIDDRDSYALVSALDETGVFDELAADGSAEAHGIVDGIVKACETGDDDGRARGVRSLLDQLQRTGAPLKRRDADRVMRALQEVRSFGDMTAIAETLIGRGQDHAELRRRYGQALIENKQIAAAIDLLDKLSKSKGAPASERSEALGLLGRANKQRYMDAPEAQRQTEGTRTFLRDAVKFYRSAMDPHQPARTHWHAINYVALAKRAERDGIALADAADAKELARRLKTELNRDPTDLWTFATLGEAALATGDVAKAAEFYGTYISAKKIDAFKLASTIRQLEEVWGLKVDDSDTGQMLGALKARLLSLPGGRIELSVPECISLTSAAALATLPIPESILGGSGPVQYRALLEGLKRAAAVGRVCRTNGLAEGTGFLVDPAAISRRLARRYPNELLFLTNSHVVSAKPHPTAMPPHEARIQFELWDDSSASGRKATVIWESPEHELDAALLRLDPPVSPKDVQPCPLADDGAIAQLRTSASLETANDPRMKATNVFIIGHPLGQRLCYSIHDTDLLDRGRRGGFPHEYFHYRTPTKSGHSGSPVFDETDWLVVALHHAGGGDGLINRLSNPAMRHRANEGVSLTSIRVKIAREI